MGFCSIQWKVLVTFLLLFVRKSIPNYYRNLVRMCHFVGRPLYNKMGSCHWGNQNNDNISIAQSQTANNRSSTSNDLFIGGAWVQHFTLAITFHFRQNVASSGKNAMIVPGKSPTPPNSKQNFSSTIVVLPICLWSVEGTTLFVPRLGELHRHI